MTISDYQFQKLCAQVQARNAVNKKANEVRTVLHDFFYPEYVGKKILIKMKDTYGGEFGKAIKSRLKEVEHDLGLSTWNTVTRLRGHFQIFTHQIYYSLDMGFATGGNCSDCAKRDFFVCSIRDGVVVECEDYDPDFEFRTDYHPAEVRDAMNEIRLLDEKIRKVKSNYYEFSI
jgi:hypothetical protein